MRVITDDGVELEVTVDGQGPGLLLVHGHGGAKEDFADHVAALARTHTVVTFDHRGHGASDKPDQLHHYSFDRLADDVLVVADAAGLATFRLLGHSMGGMVARRVVMRAPDRIDALVLMDTSPGPLRGLEPELVEIAAQVALADGKDALKELLDWVSPLDNPAYQRMLRERPGYQAFCERKWNDLSHIMWVAMVREIAGQADELEPLGAAVGNRPVLVLVGELDEPFREPSARMAAGLAAARLEVIADAGHSPQFENPAAWTAVIEGFLAGLDAPVAGY